MNLTDFQKLRTGLRMNAAPSAPEQLAEVEAAFREMLRESGVFEEVEIERTGDEDRLLIGLCEFKAEYDEATVARLLEQVWQERVSSTYWSAHAFLVEDEHVELQAATRDGSTGRYVTVHLVARRAPAIPAQRRPAAAS